MVQILGFFGNLDVEAFEDPGIDCAGDVVDCIGGCGSDGVVIVMGILEDVEEGGDVWGNPLGFFSESFVDLVDGLVEGFDVDFRGVCIDDVDDIVGELEQDVVYFAPDRKLVYAFDYEEDRAVVTEV